MLQENLLKIYEASFRENREMPALTDYFKDEEFSYYEMAKEIAKLHLLFMFAFIAVRLCCTTIIYSSLNVLQLPCCI